MIKQLIQLVMPKQLGFIGLGTALTLGVTGAKVAGSRRRDKDINSAQSAQQNIERKIRAEQGTRARREVLRTSRMQASQAEALALASGGNGSSGATTAQASINADTANNLDTINFQEVGGNQLDIAKQNTANAGKPNGFENFTTAVSPLIVGNEARINNAGSAAADDIANWFE